MRRQDDQTRHPFGERENMFRVDLDASGTDNRHRTDGVSRWHVDVLRCRLARTIGPDRTRFGGLPREVSDFGCKLR